MRKLAKSVGIFCLFIIGFWATSFFLTSSQPPKSTYLDDITLSEKQKFEHTDSLSISFGYSSSYGNRFLNSLGYTSTIYEIIKLSQNYPEVKYLINLNRFSLQEIKYLAASITNIPRFKRPNLHVYGNNVKISAYITKDFPSIHIQKTVANDWCEILYFTLNWSGYIPASCHDTIYLTTTNNFNFNQHKMHEFIIKMKSVNTETYLIGPYFHSNLSAKQITAEIENGFGNPWIHDRDEIVKNNRIIRDDWDAAQ